MTVLDHDWYPEALPENVELGERTWVHSSYAFLHYRSRRPKGVRIGDDTGVYIGTMFDLGPDGEVDIGRFCTIASPIFSSNHRVVIEDYAFVSYDVVFADSSWALPPGSTTHASEDQGEDIHVGPVCWIGARAIILGGARLGEGVIVGAGAVVAHEVPDYSIVAGNPGRVVGRALPGCAR